MKIKETIGKIQRYTGEDISSVFSWYQSPQFPIRYKLVEANTRQVIIECIQERERWGVRLKPSEFVRNLDQYWENILQRERRLK